MDSDNWSCLPRYQFKWFAVTVIENCLALVGGCDPSNKPINQLAVFNATSQEWTNPYPPMPTPRDSPDVVMYDIWLLVAGGYSGAHELATVKLFNMSTKQWLSSSPFPIPCGWMTSTILKDSCYFVTDSIGKFSMAPSLTLYHKLFLSPPLASHPHYGLFSLALH